MFVWTGSEVKLLRTELQLTAPRMAQLLGVAQNSIYRWERSDDQELRIEPMQASLLQALRVELGRRRLDHSEKEFTQDIGNALLTGGGLFALHVLLQSVYREKH